MRKIKSQAEIDRKNKKNQIIVGVILVSLLVLSTLGYSLSGNTGNEKKEFNGFKFEKQGAYWVTKIEGQEFAFQYLPQEVANVTVIGFYNLGNYAQSVLYFVNLQPEAGQEILNNLGKYIERWQEACLADSNADFECTENLPAKTCEDNLIIFSNKQNTTKVFQKNNCIYISGDFVKAADAFLYKLLRISS